MPHYPSRAPSQELPISAGWPHSQPSGSALQGGGRCVVKGAQDSVGLLGARGGKRRGSGFGHHDWPVESHRLLQNSLAVSTELWGKDVGEAVTVVSL